MPSPAAPWQHPDPALLRLRRAACLALVSLPTAVSALALLAAGMPAAAAAWALAGGTATALALTVAARQVGAWGHREREDDLVVRRGVLVRRTTVVPYGRLQYVDVVAGPLARRYGIATVVLHTAAAATDATLPGLRQDEAEGLRDRLAALGEARAAGV